MNISDKDLLSGYKPRNILSIDLKSFYASVECRERGLDPLDTNLVVADESRTDKTICLAATPSLKSYGLSGRCRLFEAKQKVKEVNYQRRKNNNYRIESNAKSLKLNDQFTVTLIADLNEPTTSIQGRIEYSDDVELVDEKNFYEYGDFYDVNNSDLSQIALGRNNKVGFGFAKNSSGGKDFAVTGTKKILTLKFKVIGSMEKNVVITWKEKNQKGTYVLTNITIPRSDINSAIVVPVEPDGENKEDQNIISDEKKDNPENSKNNENSSKENNSGISSINNKGQQVQVKEKNQNIQDNSTYNKKNRILPKTGESYILIVSIIAIIVFSIYTIIKYRKSKI